MSVVCWWDNGYRTCAPRVSVAKVIGKGLQCISCEVVFIPQDMVVSRTARALDASMAAQEEVKLCRVADVESTTVPGSMFPLLSTEF